MFVSRQLSRGRRMSTAVIESFKATQGNKKDNKIIYILM